MNSAEQTVTWLITLGVLESPKKSISDPEAFLQASLQDGAVLCRLLERLRPGTVDKVSGWRDRGLWEKIEAIIKYTWFIKTWETT